MSLITVKELSAFYENRKVFENVNFTVDDGDYLCIIGENGSGKTTLMKTVLGMNIKHTGQIVFDGFTKREIGWLSQKTQTQKDFPASVKEVVMSGFAGKGVFRTHYNKTLKEQAFKNMEILDISGIAEKSFSELSGGQQQKVLLCRALCAAKKVLLLDEPTTSLDSSAAEEIYKLVRRLNDRGLAVIMISHDINRVLCEAKHILNLSENGWFFGNVSEYCEYAKGDI